MFRLPKRMLCRWMLGGDLLIVIEHVHLDVHEVMLSLRITSCISQTGCKNCCSLLNRGLVPHIQKLSMILPGGLIIRKTQQLRLAECAITSLTFSPVPLCQLFK